MHSIHYFLLGALLIVGVASLILRLVIYSDRRRGGR
jgi:hypothetical protein